ncbi:MAG TPA: PstS family phosphate ABC transporter substrate-binding protein [Isosphaeraceae bacterium]|nr:PstS family phosphate ABC transporter substrate-binding protein [Isosphaeraceae bacterium]
MTDTRKLVEKIGLGLILGILAGCSYGGDSDEVPLKPPTAIIVDGSSTVFRISKAAQEDFSGVHPDVTLVVDNHGTGGGFGRYLQGEVDIVDASRLAKPDEESKAKAQGIEWTRFVVGYDGITLVIHRKNDFVKSLTVEQLKTIWAPASKAKKWKDVDPAWPARNIILYSPDNDSGTFEFFTEAIVGKVKSQREDVQQSSDDNTLVNGVAGDVDGLGYFGYAYYADNKDKLRAVAVQNGPAAQPVLPSPATIADKTYAPLSRPLFIYVKNSAIGRPEVAQFLRYYLDNVETLATKVNYDPVTAADKTANQEALAKLLTRGGAGAKAAAKTAE